MRYNWITIPETDFKVIEYTIYPTDELYKISYEKALEQAPLMNKHAPDGRIRSDEEIFAKCFAGCIAENGVIYRINDFADFRKKNKINAHATTFDKSRDEDQVDVVVESDKAKVTIEVRSSYGNVQNNSKRYKERFSIVGNYVTARDFMIMEDDAVVLTKGDEKFPEISTPVFQWRQFLFTWEPFYRSIYLLTPFLATINNLASAVVKTADKTMKITYTLTHES